MVDLINDKEIFCPTCGAKMSPQGKLHGNKANVMSYCPTCQIDYAWESYIDGNGNIVIDNFRKYNTQCNNATCKNSKHCPSFQKH